MADGHSPRRLDEALALLAEDPSRVPVAGCTDWMVQSPDQRLDPPGLLDLLRLEELRGIHDDGDGLRIGATTSFTELQSDARVHDRYPMLVEAAHQIGGRQIQNRGTLGGNIVNASPAGDSLPVLLALDAELEVASTEGSRRVPYHEFHTGYRETALIPGELLVAIHLPSPPAYQRFRKVGTRRAQAISKVVVALSARGSTGAWSGVRVAAGSVAPVPRRLLATEVALEGAARGEESVKLAVEAARGEVQPIDDVRSSAHYRSWVLGRVLRRMLLD